MSSQAIERGRLPDLVTLYKILFLALVAAFVSVPLLATVLGGFKSLGELRTSPFGIPQTWEWQNYAGIVLSKRYWQLLGNSLVIASLTRGIAKGGQIEHSRDGYPRRHLWMIQYERGKVPSGRPARHYDRACDYGMARPSRRDPLG